jgi:hypothetical protein
MRQTFRSFTGHGRKLIFFSPPVKLLLASAIIPFESGPSGPFTQIGHKPMAKRKGELQK